MRDKASHPRRAYRFSAALLMTLALCWGLARASTQTKLSEHTAVTSQAQMLAPVAVQAPEGLFVGRRTAVGSQFLGIAYAQAPVGHLRWTAPQRLPLPAREHMPAQTVQAFGADCVQPDPPTNDPQPGHKTKGAEDCLFLNIFLPPTNKANKANKPVMVWLHGGAFIFNSGQEVDPQLLVHKHGVVVVTLNYRLGALGFLAHNALGEGSGNFGLLDQQMALGWVQRNIAAFGGDPKRVTIFGESAGGVSVCLQLLSPAAKGLFSRAINQSGPCKAKAHTLAVQRGADYARAAGCTGADAHASATCLRKLQAATAATLSPGPVGLGDTAWEPSHGTSVLPFDEHALGRGQFHRVPILNGTNRDEGRLFALGVPTQIPDAAAYGKNLQLQFGTRAAQVLQRYPLHRYPSIALAYAAYMTDWLFACPAYRANVAMAPFVPVYAYEFDDAMAPMALPQVAHIGPFGSYHTAEMQYVFQTRTPDFARPEQFTASQKQLSDQMQAAWARFAHGLAPGLPNLLKEQPWPKMKARQPEVARLATSGSAVAHDFALFHHCDFWNSQ